MKKLETISGAAVCAVVAGCISCDAPMLLVRCVVWRRTIGWIAAITAVWSCLVQWDWLCRCILLLTGDKAGYLRDHGEVCRSLLEWNLAWALGMLVCVILFVKSRQIGRSIKSPWRRITRRTCKCISKTKRRTNND